MIRKFQVLTFMFLLCCFAAASAQDQPPQTQMSAEEKAQMEAWMKYMTPGEPHKNLEKFVGNWTITTTMFSGPEPTSSPGTCVFTMIMGNRFLQQECKGQFMGQPFHGMGFVGYDNGQQTYVSTWMDNMGTGIMRSTGTCTAGCNSYTEKGEYFDPMTGKMKNFRSEIKWTDNNKYVMQMFDVGPDGKEQKSMEISYTRNP